MGRSLLAVLFLLVVATSAAAECAWLLWEESERTEFEPYKRTVEWRLGWSAETRNECQAALLGGLRSEIAHWTRSAKERPGSFDFKSTEIGQMWALSIKESSGQTHSTTAKRYICLPETIDPRGARGPVVPKP